LIRLISDQNFNGRVLRGANRRVAHLDLIRALDVGLATADDPMLLDWAAAHDRILLTHDINTIPAFAWDRVRLGLVMPGVLVFTSTMSIGQAIDELILVVEGSSPDDWKDMVTYFPL
jgi:hypothetical protein